MSNRVVQLTYTCILCGGTFTEQTYEPNIKCSKGVCAPCAMLSINANWFGAEPGERQLNNLNVKSQARRRYR